MVTSSQKILVTGGAGFIGTHTVVQLLKGGFSVSIIDNFDNSVMEAVDRVRQVVGPLLSQNLQFTQVSTFLFLLFFSIFQIHPSFVTSCFRRAISGIGMTWRNSSPKQRTLNLLRLLLLLLLLFCVFSFFS